MVFTHRFVSQQRPLFRVNQSRTQQALGKAQAREQAASWGRGKDAADPEPPLNTNTNANNIPNCSAAAQPWHTTRGADDPHTAAIAVAEAAEAREKAKVLKLTAAVADERRASAAKDLERSEVCCALSCGSP